MMIMNFTNDVTLACEDRNSKLVDVVTVADADDEVHIADLGAWSCHKAKLLFRL